jgi:hypothetical protein
MFVVETIRSRIRGNYALLKTPIEIISERKVYPSLKCLSGKLLELMTLLQCKRILNAKSCCAVCLENVLQNKNTLDLWHIPVF